MEAITNEKRKILVEIMQDEELLKYLHAGFQSDIMAGKATEEIRVINDIIHCRLTEEWKIRQQIKDECEGKELNWDFVDTTYDSTYMFDIKARVSNKYVKDEPNYNHWEFHIHELNIIPIFE